MLQKEARDCGGISVRARYGPRQLFISVRHSDDKTIAFFVLGSSQVCMYRHIQEAHPERTVSIAFFLAVYLISSTRAAIVYRGVDVVGHMSSA